MKPRHPLLFALLPLLLIAAVTEEKPKGGGRGGAGQGGQVEPAVVPEEKGGRMAITHWQVKERLGNYTLLDFALETGRTHQFRVHAMHMGHPIVGDPEYGRGRSLGVNVPGQALHAWRLRLVHPVSGEWVEAIAPVPGHFTKLLEVLRRRQGG